MSKTEKSFLVLNGARQGMFIERRDEPLPVLLYLHGGMPEYFLNLAHPSGLEELFTVVWWEQRGSGLSYQARAPRGSITVDQLIDDTMALSDHLRNRFGQDKIYLMAHSGGTFIGVQAVARAPELYHAYVAVAQISDQLGSEQRAHQYMVAECQRRGFTSLYRRLLRCPVTREAGTPPAYLRVRDPAMHRLGIGTKRTMQSVLSGIVLASLRCPAYTIREKAQLWAGKALSGVSVVWDAMVSTDLRETTPKVDVPVYFLHGVYDYTCSYHLARSYFECLEAPRKAFYSFEQSAHCPIFEEPDRTRIILRDDVLQGKTELADAV